MIELQFGRALVCHVETYGMADSQLSDLVFEDYVIHAQPESKARTFIDEYTFLRFQAVMSTGIGVRTANDDTALHRVAGHITPHACTTHLSVASTTDLM